MALGSLYCSCECPEFTADGQADGLGVLVEVDAAVLARHQAVAAHADCVGAWQINCYF